MARWSYIKTLKSNRGAGCELQIMGSKKRNVVQRIHKLYELKLHHSVVQQLSKYVTCLSVCSFFHVWMTFSLLCIKVCHFHQAMCFLLLFFFPNTLISLRKCRDRCWNNKENFKKKKKKKEFMNLTTLTTFFNYCWFFLIFLPVLFKA